MALDGGYPDWFYDKIFNQEKLYNAYIACLINNDGSEGQIIGYIMLQSSRINNSSYIQGLFVEEKYRNMGIAKRLIEEAENYSKKIGSRYIEAEITYNLFRLYSKLGYFVTKSITSSKNIIQKDLEKEKGRNSFIKELQEKAKNFKKTRKEQSVDNQYKNNKFIRKGEKELADD